MPTMLNNTNVVHPLRWVGGAALAVVLAYLVGLGVNPPVQAGQCTSVVAPTR